MAEGGRYLRFRKGINNQVDRIRTVAMATQIVRCNQPITIN